MVILFGVQLSAKISFFKALTSVAGIGSAHAYYLCYFFGLSPQIPIGSVSRQILKEVNRITLQTRVVGLSLKRATLNSIRSKIQLKSYQGFRHMEGLPVRGQNTRSNARTIRRLKRAKQIISL